MAKEEILIYRNILLENGYLESSRKPNLFFRKISQGVFFADMRGTKEVPIYEDSSPLYYAQFNEDLNLKEKSDYFVNEYYRLHNLGCPVRLSFEYNGEFGDFCEWCGKLQSEGMFCSKECEEKYENEVTDFCSVCGKEIEIGEYVEHHIDYNKDITILICSSCHSKITFHLDKYPELRKFEPVGTRKEMLKNKKKKKRYCFLCNQLLKGRQLKYCLKCKEKMEKEKIAKRNKKKNKYMYYPKKHNSIMKNAYTDLLN